MAEPNTESLIPLDLGSRMERGYDLHQPSKEKTKNVNEILQILSDCCKDFKTQGSWHYNFKTCRSDVDGLATSVDTYKLSEIDGLKFKGKPHTLSNGLRLHQMEYKGIAIDLSTGRVDWATNRHFNNAIKSMIESSSRSKKIFLFTVIQWSKYFDVNNPVYFKTAAWLCLAHVFYRDHNPDGSKSHYEMYRAFYDFLLKLLTSNYSFALEFAPGTNVTLARGDGSTMQIVFLGINLTQVFTAHNESQMQKMAVAMRIWLCDDKSEKLDWTMNKKICHCEYCKHESNCPLQPVFAAIKRKYMRIHRTRLLAMLPQKVDNITPKTYKLFPALE